MDNLKPYDQDFSYVPLSSSSLPSSSREEWRNRGEVFSIYVRLYAGNKPVWYRFRSSNYKEFDKEMKNGITQMLEKEDTNWTTSVTVMENRIHMFNGKDGHVLDFKRVGGGFGSSKLALASMKYHWNLPMIDCLNGCIYVIGDHRYNDDIRGWGEVLRPQSTEWELLSSPAPLFGTRSSVFLHAVDNLDKLVLGSFEDNFLYLYDPKTTGLEKVNNFWRGGPLSLSGDTIVVGNYLIWCGCDILFLYDLVERKLYDEIIEGPIYEYLIQTCDACWPKLVYLGGGTFYIIFTDTSTAPTHLQFFEFSLWGTDRPFRPKVTFSYNCSSISSAQDFLDVLLISE